jgi:hypothetical protein
MPRVSQIAEDLAQKLNASYVESARCVRKGRGTYFDYDFHTASMVGSPDGKKNILKQNYIIISTFWQGI